MYRIFATLASLFLLNAVVTAGPIPWMYSVWMKPAGGADGILLGNETRWEYDHSTGSEKGTAYNVLSYIGANGYLSFGYEMPTERMDMFRFGYGNWDLKEQLPADVNYAVNRFVLDYTFTDQKGNSFLGTTSGFISADGVFTTGTGNLLISLDNTEEITLGGKKANVHFGTRSSESQSVITMDVTEVVETPEPATIALAGMGLAGVLGYRRQALRKPAAAV